MPTMVLLTCCALGAFFFACDFSGMQISANITYTGKTMGTSYNITICAGPKDNKIRPVHPLIKEELERINDWMSTYLADSELSRFNRFEGREWLDVSPATAQVVKEAQRVSRATKGAFDVTVGPLVKLWNFGPDPGPMRVPESKAIEAARARVGFEKLEVRDDPPALRKLQSDLSVNLSAIAKGFGVDRVAELLDRLDIKNYLVEIGGEVRTRGTKLDGSIWRIGVEMPADNKRVVNEIVELRNLSLATSGDYRNFFIDGEKRYSHTIHPRTGMPVEHSLASVTVIRPTCMEADALATALMVLGPEEGFAFASEHDIAALFLVRENDAFTRKPTPAFESLVKKPAGK